MKPTEGSQPFSSRRAVLPFASPDRERQFLDLVRRRLGRAGRSVTIRGGAAQVEGQAAVHELANLAQLCNQSPIETWPQLVDEHCAKSEDVGLQNLAMAALGDGFAANTERLAVRVYPPEFARSGLASHVVHRVDVPGTVTVAVLDLGASVMPLPTAIAAQWGVPTAELFACGIANLARLCTVRWEVLHVPLGDGFAFDLLGDDFYAAASVLRPEPFLPRIGAHGNLLAMPARGLLLSWPIDELPSLYPIESMLAMARGKFVDGPGSISPHLFWRTTAGEFRLQQGAVDDGLPRLAPSPDFAELIVQLQRRRPRGSGR